MTISNRIKFLALVPLFIVTGYFIGSFIGNKMIRSYVVGTNNIISLLYRPTMEYLFQIESLTSPDEMERLSGYYSLLENNNIDLEFLSDRFNRENSLYIKRTIIWILGFSPETEETADFFKSIFKESDKEIKKEILKSYKRLDSSRFLNFIKEQKIDIGKLDL